ncbi:hypothetical protein KJ966_10460 [bacterium]|nr:hypothetical protein [bacterium]
MNNLTNYHEAIHSLASQLEKLLKVIGHSDPSAERMKHVLYDKYKENLSDIAGDLKPLFSWSALLQYLNRLKISDNLLVSPEQRETIVNKMIKDFEGEFVLKHELSEFSAPNPVDTRQKERLKRIRKQIRNNRKSQEQIQTQNSLFEMVQFKNQQKTAKDSLNKLVKALNKISPQKLEVPINQNNQE